jgi:hypothetical protein
MIARRSAPWQDADAVSSYAPVPYCYPLFRVALRA